MACVTLWRVISTMPSEQVFRWAKQGISDGEVQVSIWLFFGVCVPMGIWLIVSLPLVIAAIATWGQDRTD